MTVFSQSQKFISHGHLHLQCILLDQGANVAIYHDDVAIYHDDSVYDIFHDDILDPDDGNPSDTYLDNTYTEGDIIRINHNNVNLAEDNQNDNPIHDYLVDNDNDAINDNQHYDDNHQQFQ